MPRFTHCLQNHSLEPGCIFSIIYIGNHPIYKSLSDLNKEDKYTQPIYVGKAVPAGARKGGGGLDVEHGTALYKRLSEHAASIASVEDLDLGDFRCRFLVVDDIWIPLAESLLIKRFAPVWNRVLDGFGNHDPGKGRYQGKKPFWDAVHPGREWADRLQPGAYTREELMRRVEAYLQRLDKPV